MCRKDDSHQDLDNNNVVEAQEVRNPYQRFFENPNSAVNQDFRAEDLKSLNDIVKTRGNILKKEEFVALRGEAH